MLQLSISQSKFNRANINRKKEKIFLRTFFVVVYKFIIYWAQITEWVLSYSTQPLPLKGLAVMYERLSVEPWTVSDNIRQWCIWWQSVNCQANGSERSTMVCGGRESRVGFLKEVAFVWTLKTGEIWKGGGEKEDPAGRELCSEQMPQLHYKWSKEKRKRFLEATQGGWHVTGANDQMV